MEFIRVPFKTNQCWQQIFAGRSQEYIVQYINDVWFANEPFEIILQKKKENHNPNQLELIFEKPIEEPKY